jgi:hypothetical protein
MLLLLWDRADVWNVICGCCCVFVLRLLQMLLLAF